MAHDRTKFRTKVSLLDANVYEATVDVISNDTGEIINTYSATGTGPQSAASAAVNLARDDRLAAELGDQGAHNIMGEVEITADSDISTAGSGETPSPGSTPAAPKKPPNPNLSGQAGKRKIKAPKLPKKESFSVDDPEPSVVFVKGNPRNHVPWTETWTDEDGNEVPWSDGRGNEILEEPVPEFFERAGDRIIRGIVDNNAMIVLGRDRTGIDEKYKTDDDKSDLSGYSDHMGAGAIDIVVGRGAPFPVKGDFLQGPLFRMKENANMEKYPLRKADGSTQDHPGILMDAARIYISQMTTVDANFGIRRFGTFENTSVKIPTSGIVLKADKIRLFARQDIKIVTAAPEEQKYNSMGNDLSKISGIHLMAGNASVGDMQPIPLGNNLKDALEGMVDLQSETLDLLMEFARAQIVFNKILGTHHHQSPVFGMPTTPSGMSIVGMVQTMLDQLSRVVMGVAFGKFNLMTNKINFLSAAGGRYINSDFNKTN